MCKREGTRVKARDVSKRDLAGPCLTCLSVANFILREIGNESINPEKGESC